MTHSRLTQPLMRAARYHQIGGTFSIDQVERPVPTATDVVVQVKACGVVPNLINVLEKLARQPGLHPLKLPAIYGLDAAGVVAEKGALVHGVDVGDRVYVNPRRYCGSCRYCRMGDVSACDHLILSGYFGKGPKAPQMLKDYPAGGFAEYMVAPQYSLVALPENVDFATGARWGYLGTSYSALRRAKVDMTSNVLINGVTGTLGLGAVLFALALGAPQVFGVARDVKLLERVKSLAPNRIHVLSATGDVSVESWARSLTNGDGVDVVLDALPTGGDTQAFVAALASLRKGGRHVNVGGVRDLIPVSFVNFVINNQTLIGSSWFTPAEGQEMADLAASGTVRLDVFEHKAFALEDINSALGTIGDRQGGFSNYVILPSGH